jgi:dihydropteroate synthase
VLFDHQMTDLSVYCAGIRLNLSSPQVMGILNITPDSFSEVGRVTSPKQALAHAQRLVSEGATIIDVGGEPTNPSVHLDISVQEELDRVMPVIELLTRELSVPISVDTSKALVMAEAIKQGVHLINDVRALREPAALDVVTKSDVAVCLMHMRYPYGVSLQPVVGDEDIVITVKDFLEQRVQACIAAGISLDRIIVDPGIGHGNFGKNLAQNLHLLKELAQFKKLNLPILVGVSRKTFIGELLGAAVSERLHGSIAAALMAVLQGASIIRVHDVKATVDALKVMVAINLVKP